MVSHSISDLKAAYVSRLRKEGQSVSVDVVISPLLDDSEGPQNTVDILTDHEIIFCTMALDERTAIALKSKLAFYGRFSPSWKKVIVAQRVIDASAADLLADSDIKLVVMSSAAIAQAQSDTIPVKGKPGSPSISSGSTTLENSLEQTSSEQASSEQAFSEPVLYRYPALDSIQGGDGIYAFVIAFTVIILVGMVGVYFTWEQAPPDDSPPASSLQSLSLAA